MQLRLFRHFVPVSAALLAAADAVLIAFALSRMVPLPGSAAAGAGSPLAPAFAPGLAAAMIVAMIAVGLYREGVFQDFRQLTARMLVASGVMPVLAFAAVLLAGVSPAALPEAATLAIKATLVWLGCVSLARGAFLATLGRGWLQRRIIVLGDGSQVSRIAQLVEAGDNPNFVPVSFVGMPAEAEDARSLGWSDMDAGALADFARRTGAGEIVIASDDRRGSPVRQLLGCKLAGIKVTDFLDFWERETRTLDLDALKPSWLFYSDGFRCGALDKMLKRIFDIGASLMLLLLALPLLALAALAIRLDSPGPVIYRQERVGRRGRVFTILKFRSMRVDAESSEGPRWAAERDPRVTRIGALLRKLRIDELPQIFNVLRGDMSFVGPRPERPFFVDELAAAIPYYRERHWVRPGITGWAQINFHYGASLDDARRKLAFDLYYVKNQSVFLDLTILLQTARVILWSEGAR